MEIRIHSALVEGASRQRRQEWDLALEDLNHEPLPGEGSLTIYQNNNAATLVVSQGGHTHFIELEADALKPHLEGYRDIIQRMVAASRGDGMRSIETLDYAKKLIHDEAGEFVIEALDEGASLELDLPTGRRLFTLIFLILTDLPEAQVTNHKVHL